MRCIEIYIAIQVFYIAIGFFLRIVAPLSFKPSKLRKINSNNGFGSSRPFNSQLYITSYTERN